MQNKKSSKAASAKTQSPLTVGEKVLIRTVSFFQLGRIVGLTPTEILLNDASWVADTARFSNALKTGQLNEVEPFPDGVISVNRLAVVDVCVWAHDLPREVK
jgi:hypothetical protein